jgi:hypothetical protein
MRRGFTIIEEILAMSILSIYIVSATLFISTMLQSVATISSRQQAVSIAVSNIHAEFENSEQGFISIAPIATSTQGIYQSSVSIQIESDGTAKDIESYVQWKDVFKQIHHIEISTFIYDSSFQPDTYECNSIPWDNQTVFQQLFLSFNNLLPGNLLTSSHAISSMNVSSSTLYAIASSTTQKTDPDLFIFNISSSTKPIYESSLDTSPSTKLGLNGISINTQYVYAANGSQSNFATCKTGSSCAQLQVIDVQNASAPVLLANFQLATTALPYASGSEGQSVGKSIAYSQGRIYLGLSKGPNVLGDEFNIIDVRNPSSPLWLGGYHVGRSINKIRIKGAYAYLATDGPEEEVLILDISDPAHITTISSFTAPGSSLYGYGKDLSFASSTILLGRSYAQGSNDFIALSLDPDHILTTLNAEIAASSSNPISITSILSFNNSAYVLTNEDLEFWDLVDTSNPKQSFQSISAASQSINTSLACSSSTLYVSSIGITGSTTLSILKRI